MFRCFEFCSEKPPPAFFQFDQVLPLAGEGNSGPRGREADHCHLWDGVAYKMGQRNCFFQHSTYLREKNTPPTDNNSDEEGRMHNKIFHTAHLRRLHGHPKREKKKSEMINARILGSSPQICGRCFDLWLMSGTNVSKYGLPTSLVQPWSQLNPYHCVCVQQPPHLQIFLNFNVGFMNHSTFCTTDFLSSFPMYDAVTL